MFYLDTSVLVTTVVSEAARPHIQKWLSDQKPGTLAISHWTMTEFSSALSLKIRTRQISQATRANAAFEFRRLVAESMIVLGVSAASFLTAARLADNHETGLRGSDALHLAIASENGAILCTRDRRQAEAGLALGLQARLVGSIDHPEARI